MYFNSEIIKNNSIFSFSSSLVLKSLTEAAAGSTTKSRAAKKFSVIIIDSRPKLEGMKLDLCYIIFIK